MWLFTFPKNHGEQVWEMVLRDESDLEDVEIAEEYFQTAMKVIWPVVMSFLEAKTESFSERRRIGSIFTAM